MRHYIYMYVYIQREIEIMCWTLKQFACEYVVYVFKAVTNVMENWEALIQNEYNMYHSFKNLQQVLHAMNMEE